MTRPLCSDCGKPTVLRRGKRGRYPKRCAACKRKAEQAYARQWWADHPDYQRTRRALQNNSSDQQKTL